MNYQHLSNAGCGGLVYNVCTFILLQQKFCDSHSVLCMQKLFADYKTRATPMDVSGWLV